MKNKLLIIINILFLSLTVAHAKSISNGKPQKCPNRNEVWFAGFSSIKKVKVDGLNWWMAQNRSKYDTDQEWIFLELFQEENLVNNDPMATAIEYLNAYVENPVGPEKIDSNQNAWACLYTIPRKLWLVTITPASAASERFPVNG